MTMTHGLSLALASISLTALLGMNGALRAEDTGEVAIKVDKDHVDFLHGTALSARYHFGPKVAKPYFWPVNSPDGTALTRAWPMGEAIPGEALDHIHQKSLWFCHGDVIPEGLALNTRVKGVDGVDFWSENVNRGKLICTKVGTPEVKGNHGKVTTTNEWLTPDDEKILDEVRTIQFYDLGTAQLFVLDIDLHAGKHSIIFGDTKEGSLGVRVRHELTEAKGKGTLTNAEGKAKEKACWGQNSAWCDYSGPVGDKTIGIAVFADPNNPVPTCWHSRGYGLMAANPFGRDKAGFPAVKGNKELVKLARGEHLKLRYGVLLHQGDATEGKVADYYKKFTELK